MSRTETVAVVTMLCDEKAALIPLLTPRWDAIDFGGRNVVYVAVCNDASPQTEQAFRDSTRRPVFATRVADMAAAVPDLEHEADVRAEEGQSNIIYLHRMAMMREAGRRAALGLRFGQEEGKGRPVDWVFWIDSDVDPREHGFACLHQILTANKGPQRPRVAAGLYCTRNWGQDISGWIGDGGRTYTPLVPDQVQSSRVAGFGCVLMRRQTLADLPFDTYTKYREYRRWQREINRADTEGVFGEDVWWFRQLERAYGMAPLVDNRVLCRHYHADGCYWRYEVDEASGYLRPVYCTDDQIPGAGIAVRNVGAEVIRLDPYRFELAPGQEARVSTEISRHLQAMGAKVEVAA